jgi:hypothetical protein
MGMFESAKGTLNGVKPGKHVLELRVVASDHQTELGPRHSRFTANNRPNSLNRADYYYLHRP